MNPRNKIFVAGLSQISQQGPVSHDKVFTSLEVSYIISRHQYSSSRVTTPSSVLSAKLPVKPTTHIILEIGVIYHCNAHTSLQGPERIWVLHILLLYWFRLFLCSRAYGKWKSNTKGLIPRTHHMSSKHSA